MKTFLALLALVVLLVLLDRLARRLEDRGWIYYRCRRGSSGALGDAFLEVQSLEPAQRAVLEARREVVDEAPEPGEPPEAGEGARR
jgi:hypothetical protein